VLSSFISVKTIWIGARRKSQEFNARNAAAEWARGTRAYCLMTQLYLSGTFCCRKGATNDDIGR
jgi:hypothetical protein